MQLTVQDSQLAAMWSSFLEERCLPEIQLAAQEYPDTKSFVVPFPLVQRANPELAEYILQRPHHALRVGETSLFTMDMVVDPKPHLRLRVSDLPDDLVLLPRQLRSEHLGHLVAVEGIVQARNEARNVPLEAAFECKSCGNIVHLIQEDDVVAEPVMCDACEKSGKIWRFRDDLTTWVDHQILVIQERPDQLRGSSQPEARYLLCRDDLVYQAEVGDHVIANCIPTPRVRRVQGSQRSIEYDTALQAVSIERPGHEFADAEMTPEEKQKAHELAASGQALKKLAKSIAPHVHGMDPYKEAAVYCLVGAPDETSDGQRIRGNIHMLLVGDPGVAKTQIILDLEKVAPRCVVATGTTTSAAGLGAAASQDKTLGKWILEAGALVMASEGICVIDEIGHLQHDDMKHLHSSMEEGVVRYTKVVKAKLRADTTIVAAMNPPVGERFDRFQDVSSQIGIPGALLSRFDLVYCMQDNVDDAHDAEVAMAVLGRRNGLASKLHERVMPIDEMRRYLLYAKTIVPHLTKDAVELLMAYYQKVRRATRDRPGITPRNVDALGRLTLAHARIRLSEEATAEDPGGQPAQPRSTTAAPWTAMSS